MTLAPGTRLGSYEILAPLGAGGMGEVYRARDFKLKRDVAIKVLPRSLAADPEALARFEREALAVAALSHPNILSIFDFGTQDGISYAVTELLEGETLRGRLDAGPIPQTQVVDYAFQTAKALSAAHEKGIVHRDLKPENLFIARDGHLKILDFGLAKRTEQHEDGGTSALTESKYTKPGVVMGTVGYMSPEEVRGLPLVPFPDRCRGGTGVVRSLTDDPADDCDPGFSPDGRSLLWSSNRSGNLEVWASNPDGTGAHQVTHDGVDAQNPTQTRDGKWIVYSCANRPHQGLRKIHPDGTGAELLARGVAQVLQVSPDGNWAAYLINVRTTSILHVIRVEDANDMTFAVLSEPRRKTQIQRGRARWTPGSNRILFTGQDQRGLDGIFIQDFVPGKDTASTRRPLAGFDPEWITESLSLSPDGGRLVLSEAERVFSLMVAEGFLDLRAIKGAKDESWACRLS